MEDSSSRGASRGESIGPLRSDVSALERVVANSGPSMATTAYPAGSGRKTYPVTRDCFPTGGDGGADGGGPPQTLQQSAGVSGLPNSCDLKFSVGSMSTVALERTRQPQEQRQHLQRNFPTCPPEHPADVMSHPSHPSNGVAFSHVDRRPERGAHPSLTGSRDPVSPDAVPEPAAGPGPAGRGPRGDRGASPPSASASPRGGIPPQSGYGGARCRDPDGHSIRHESLSSPSPSLPADPGAGRGDARSLEALASRVADLRFSPTMAPVAGEGWRSPATSLPAQGPAPAGTAPRSHSLSDGSVNSIVSLQPARLNSDKDGEDEVEDDEVEFYTFVILHDAQDDELAEAVKVTLEELNISPGVTFDDLKVGGEHQIGTVERAVDNSAYTVLLLTYNFEKTFMEFMTHATLMNSINHTHKYNTVIPLLPRSRRPADDKIPFALRAINHLDMRLKTFDKKACNTFSKVRVDKQRKLWRAERVARAADERERRRRMRESEAARLAALAVVPCQPEDGGRAVDAQGVGPTEAEAGRTPPCGAWNQGCAAEAGVGVGGCVGNVAVESHSVQVNFPSTGPLPPGAGVGGPQNINIINITGVQNVQVGTNNVIQPGPVSPASDGNDFSGSDDNGDEANDCQDE